MTPSLFHESIDSALREVIGACGGFKTVGIALRPEKDADAASRWLHACLAEDRPERLSPDQALFILREGRKAQSHAAINYLLRESGYADAQPIEPEDERAALQRQFNQRVDDLKTILARLDRNETPLRKVA